MSHFLGTPSRSHVWNLCEHQAKQWRKRLLSGPTVDIYVGSSRKHWSLHKNLLCHHSSYFQTELVGHEVPKQERKSDLELPDEDPRGFELLVKWLYQGQLDDSEVEGRTGEEKYDYAVACHKLYQLCDKFDIISLKNQAMDAYRLNLNSAQLVPDAEEIDTIYRRSEAGSPFQILMTKIAARQIMDPGIEKDADGYRRCFQGNEHFAIDMINEIRKMSGGILFDDPTADGGCKWHDHRDGSTCQSNKDGGSGAVGTDATVIKSPSGKRSQLSLPSAPSSVAELSERPTPRKLNKAIPRSPAKLEATRVTNGAPTHTTIVGKPSSPTIAKRAINGVSSARATRPTSSGVQSKATFTSNEIGRASSTPEKTESHADVAKGPISTLKAPRRTVSLNRTKSPYKTATQNNDANVNAKSRQTESHVNGVVQHLNSVYMKAPSENGSTATSEKRAPPKSKWKVSG